MTILDRCADFSVSKICGSKDLDIVVPEDILWESTAQQSKVRRPLPGPSAPMAGMCDQVQA